jgi:hypothetical protein
MTPRGDELVANVSRQPKPTVRRSALGIGGAVAIAIGLLGISAGSLWAPTALELVAQNDLTVVFELLVPFLPVLLTAFGALAMVKSRE